MHVLVKHLMKSPVVSLFAEQTVPLAEDIMRFKHIRHLPVIDDEGHLVGLVSHRDLLRARKPDLRVRDLMTRDVWTVTPDTLASVAGRTLGDHRFGCLPVVDARHVVVGIVTEHDFLTFATKAIAMHD
jgi:CBS domain-containing membrane protein